MVNSLINLRAVLRGNGDVLAGEALGRLGDVHEGGGDDHVDGSSIVRLGRERADLKIYYFEK